MINSDNGFNIQDLIFYIFNSLQNSIYLIELNS